jgi:acyl-CoA reductase-like NAD-dependent aldehyde dehydrogenase
MESIILFVIILSGVGAVIAPWNFPIAILGWQ